MLEKLNAMHPSVKNAMREMQGLRVNLVASVAPDTNTAVAEIKGEDSLVSAINNVAGVLTVVDVSTLTIADGFAHGSAVFTAVIATDEITINGNSYVGVAGAKANNTQFSVDTSDTAAVADLVASINSRDGANVTAVANGTTLEITAVAEGATIGNAITFVSIDTTIVETGAGTLINGTGVKANGTLTVSGPSAGVTVTVDGKVYTLVTVANSQTAKVGEFAIGGTDTLTAANLVSAINAREGRPDGGGNVVATNVAGVVTVTAVFFGTGSNSVTLVGATGITASNATLTGGLIVGGFIRNAAAFNQLILTWFNKR